MIQATQPSSQAQQSRSGLFANHTTAGPEGPAVVRYPQLVVAAEQKYRII